MRLDYSLSCGLLFPRQRPSAGTPSSARRMAGAVFTAALALSIFAIFARPGDDISSFRNTTIDGDKPPFAPLVYCRCYESLQKCQSTSPWHGERSEVCSWVACDRIAIMQNVAGVLRVMAADRRRLDVAEYGHEVLG